MSSSRPVALAIIGCAQVRAALQRLLRERSVRLRRADAAVLLRDGIVAASVIVARPLPHFANHVEKSVAVWGKRPSPARSFLTVQTQIFAGERPCQVFAR